MPSSSKKQHNFMAAVAHSPSFAKKVGVPQSVGKDFTEADKGKKMNPRARKVGGISRYSGTEGSLVKVKPGQVPKGKDPAAWWSANEANAMRPGEKSALPSKKAPKKAVVISKTVIMAKPKVRVSKSDAKSRADAEIAKIQPQLDQLKDVLKMRTGGHVMAKKVKRYDEGGDVNSDEGEGSENVKRQTADYKVAQSKAEDAKGKLDMPKRRGFFGSLFSGNYSKYKAQKASDEATKKAFSGIKSAKTMEAEKERADLDKPEKSNVNKIDLSGGVETAADMYKRHRKAAKRQKKQQQQQQGNKSGSFSSAFAAARKSGSGTFEWNGKKYSTAVKGTAASAPKAKTANKDDSKSVMFKKQEGPTFGGMSKSMKGTEKYAAGAGQEGKFKPGEKQSLLNKQARLRQDIRNDFDAKKKSSSSSNPRGSMAGVVKKAKGGFCGDGSASTKAYKAGGLVSSRADGIASRGRTRCKIV